MAEQKDNTIVETEQHQLARTAVERAVQDLEALIVQARGYEREQAIVVAFCDAFPPLTDDYRDQMRCTVGVGVHVLNGVLVMWDAHRLQDVTPRVAWLAQRLGKFTIDDAPEMGRRTYDFGRLKLCVFFNTNDEKTVCRFVEVGKEERPVYKLMCGEAESAESIEAGS